MMDPLLKIGITSVLVGVYLSGPFFLMAILKWLWRQ